jgi:hypothetical protein
MAFTMFDLSVPVLLHGVDVMSSYIEKAAEFAAERKIEPSILVNARLAPDMLSLAGQMQRASDDAKGAIARLAGIEAPSFPDVETTLTELDDRLQRTASFLREVTPAQLEGSEHKLLTFKFRSVHGTLRGDAYLLTVLLPNFFFHVATTHDILRHAGMNIGKKDYLGLLPYEG